METSIITASSQETILDEVEALYDAGRFVHAYRVSKPLGKLGRWPGVQGRLLAGRLASTLGRERWSHALLKLAGREYPGSSQAIYYSMRAYIQTHGPLIGLRRMEQKNARMEEADPDTRADWYGLHAWVMASVRDFERAHRWLDQAEEISPSNPWILTLRSSVLQLQDQRDAALEVAEHALQLQPWYWPAAEHKTSLLLDRGDQVATLRFIEEAMQRIESFRMTGIRIRLLMENERYAESNEQLQRLVEMDVLGSLTTSQSSWLKSIQVKLAYYQQQWKQAAQRAREITDHPYYEALADRFEKLSDGSAPETAQRIRIPVPFVRQNHLTCAPATMAGLAAYFGKPITHEEIASRICYNGTAAYDERRWAEQNGFHAREFRVTMAITEQLIRAGIPFSLTTVGIEMGHLQTVVGFDSTFGVLLVQDPNSPWIQEYEAQSFLEHFASSGPRGMVMVPEEQLRRLTEIELPDAELYDLQYQVDLALAQHDRVFAQQVIDQMQELAEGHRLTIQCQISLARYDGNDSILLKHLSRLQESYPNDMQLMLFRFSKEGDQNNRQKRLSDLMQFYQGIGPHPFIASRLTEELLDDARSHGMAAWVLNHATRRSAPSPSMAAANSKMSWIQGDNESLVNYLRIAACLDDRNEDRLRAYFNAARHMHREDEAMKWLEHRTNMTPRQAGPFVTLSWAYEQLQQPVEALRILEDAIAALPEDGNLLTYAAYKLNTYGRIARARELLALSKGKCSEANYHRTAAQIDSDSGDLHQAQQHLVKVLEVDPLDMGTVHHLLQIDQYLDGDAAARRRLDTLLEQFPKNYSIRATFVSWIRQNAPSESIAAIHRMLEDFPEDPWTLREAAVVQMQYGTWSDAESLTRQAIEVEPKNCRNWTILGRCQHALGKIDESRDSFRTAISCSVDETFAMKPLVELCQTAEERREVLEFIYGELVKQTTYGDGIIGYYGLALDNIPLEDLHQRIAVAQRERSDLPHPWTCLVDVLCRLKRTQEAIEVGNQAAARFPLYPQIWIDLSRAQNAAGDEDGCLQSLEQAHSIDENNAQVAKMLSEMYRSRSELDRAQSILSKAVQANTRDGVLMGHYADNLWDLGKQSEALQAMQRAIILEPTYEWAWSTLCRWCTELKSGSLLLDTARTIVESHPNDSLGWLYMADAYVEIAEYPKAIDACDQAIHRNVRLVRAYQTKAWALSKLGLHQESIAATEPEVFRDAPQPALMMIRSDLLYLQGRVDEAFEIRREAARLDPDNFLGWWQLMRWAYQRSEIQIQRECATHCMRLDSKRVEAYGYMAHSLIAEAEYDAAEMFLGIAMGMDPAYAFVYTSLFELHLRKGDPGAARKVMDQGKQYLEAEEVQIMTIRLHLAERDQAGAIKMIQDLKPHANHRARLATLLTQHAPHLDELYQRCCDQLLSGHATDMVGFLWSVLRTSIQPKDSLWTTLKKIPPSEGFDAALEHLLSLEGNGAIPLALTRQIGAKFRKRILANSSLWVAMARKLNRHNEYLATVLWSRSRTNVRDIQSKGQWYPAILAAWMINQPNMARPWIQAALELPDDEFSNVMRLWGALDATLRTSSLEARKLLEQIDPSTLHPWFSDLHQLVIWYVRLYAPQTDRKKRSTLRRKLRRGDPLIPKIESLPWLRKALGRKLALEDHAWLEWLAT